MRDLADADVPIVGRAKVAARFGISASTLKRWQADAELEERFRLRDFIFRMRSRVATTPRMAIQFVEHMASIDPRETVQRDVADVAEELRRFRK
jgi:hypothetical protein